MTVASPPVPVLHGSTIVNVPIDQAFGAFTRSLDGWWPRDYHIGRAEMAEAVLEPGEGGRWYERGVDGSECEWGRVLVWEPPHRLVVTWQINGRWQYDPDPAHASEIEVRFTAAGPDRTSILLEHRHIERLVEASALVDGIEQQGGGWTSLLQRFGAFAVTAGRVL
jgi:uncharacterized protein YndB with AHSA1/START domain